MATLTAIVTYPDNKAVDIRDTLAEAFEYARHIEGMQNPPTKVQFIQQVVNTHMKEWLRNTYSSQKIKDFIPTDPEIITS